MSNTTPTTPKFPFKINKNGRPLDKYSSPLKVNWNTVFDNKEKGEPLLKDAFIKRTYEGV